MCGLPPRMHVALRAVELRRHLELAARSRRPRSSRAVPGCDLRVARLLQQHRQPADLRVRRRCRPRGRRCARARSGSAWPGSSAGPAARVVATDDVDLVAAELLRQRAPFGLARQHLSAAWPAVQRRARRGDEHHRELSAVHLNVLRKKFGKAASGNPRFVRHVQKPCAPCAPRLIRYWTNTWLSVASCRLRSVASCNRIRLNSLGL